MTTPHPRCPIGTGAEHDRHAFQTAGDFEMVTVTCAGWTEPLVCLDSRGGDSDACKGPVEYREPLSGTGASFPRCEAHWSKRLDVQEGINARYGHPDSDVPPPGFDPLDAGERYHDDY